MITSEQLRVLAWIIDEAGGNAMFEQMYGDKQTLTASGGKELVIEPSDLRELVDVRLVRHVGGVRYEVTNQGRLFHEQQRNPLPENPVGFSPS